MNKIRIGLLGGGTGGHIYPLIAVAEKLRRWESSLGSEITIRYFGDAGDYRGELEQAGIQFSGIVSSKWRRYFSLKNFLDIAKAAFGFLQALWKIYWFMPDVVFMKGGPGSLVIAYVCRFYAIPLIVHESDTVPGLSNRLAGKFAKIVEIAFKEAAAFFPSGKSRLVGIPIREAIFLGETTRARSMLGLTEDGLPVLLMMGGSQGAEKINAFILDNLEILLDRFRIIHQVGRNNYDSYMSEYSFAAKNISEEKKKNYRPSAFLGKELPEAMAAADLIVSRAGGTTIFEIAARAKPSVLIPLALAAHDHQRENAYAYAKPGACLVIEEENLLVGLFISELEQLLHNPSKLKSMSEAAKNFYLPGAAESIAEDLVKIAGAVPSGIRPPAGNQ